MSFQVSATPLAGFRPSDDLPPSLLQPLDFFWSRGCALDAAAQARFYNSPEAAAYFAQLDTDDFDSDDDAGVEPSAPNVVSLADAKQRRDKSANQSHRVHGAAVAGKHRIGHGLALYEAERCFTRWLSDHYELTALHAELAAVAAHWLGGDPVWIMNVSGSGDAKTETAHSMTGAGAFVTSTINSEGALLSGTSAHEKSSEATGGLLRELGADGILVIKDVTPILSMGSNVRASVLAALREIADGRWVRRVGSDGGKTLTWEGRLTVIGAVTTAWDAAHDVISKMGDRFVIVRGDTSRHRLEKGRQAARNLGKESVMRQELESAVASVIGAMDHTPIELTDDECERLLRVTEFVARCRTGVERDYKGNVIDVHALEMPTRFNVVGGSDRAATTTSLARLHTHASAVVLGRGRRVLSPPSGRVPRRIRRADRNADCTCRQTAARRCIRRRRVPRGVVGAHASHRTARVGTAFDIDSP